MSDDPTLQTRLRDAGADPSDEFRARLRHRLEHELAGTTVIEPAVSAPPSSPRRSWWWMASAAAVVIGLLTVALLRSPNDTVTSPNTTTDPTLTTTAPPTTDTAVDTTSPQTTTRTDVPTYDAKLLEALTSSTWILTDAEGWPIPLSVPYLTPLPPGEDGLIGMFDGCNVGSINGVIDDARLRITEGTSTTAGCPDIEPITLPSDSMILLTDDGRTLTVREASGVGPMLTFRRKDVLGTPVQRDQLVGWWSAGDAVDALFHADGRLTADSCTWSWVLEASGELYVYESATAVPELCEPLFRAAVANGPFATRIDEGVLWLLGDSTVLRLEPIDEPLTEPIDRPFPTIDIAPWLVPIDDLSPCDAEQCPSLAIAPDGTIVSYLSADHSITVGRRGELPPRVLMVEGPAPAFGYLLGVGPDDVAYLVVEPTDAVDPLGDVIAVPLSGSSAGNIVARADGVADLSGDSRLVAARTGWVGVGCCGFDPIEPAPEQTPVLGWVDRTGSATTFDRPLFSMERSDDTVTFVRTDTDEARATWDITAAQALGINDMPSFAATADGSVIVAWWDVLTSRTRLLRLRAEGGIEEIVVPTDLSVFDLSPLGTALVYDGSQFFTWQLPGFAEPTDATAAMGDLAGPGSFATADDLVAQLLRVLSQPDGCEVAPSASVVARTDDPTVVVTIAARSGCDDSGGGADITLRMAQDPNGSWVVASAERSSLCVRGASGELCI